MSAGQAHLSRPASARARFGSNVLSESRFVRPGPRHPAAPGLRGTTPVPAGPYPSSCQGGQRRELGSERMAKGDRDAIAARFSRAVGVDCAVGDPRAATSTPAKATTFTGSMARSDDPRGEDAPVIIPRLDPCA